MSISLAWTGFFNTYVESWGRRHGLLGLVLHASSNAIGCIRAGGYLSALRTCTNIEGLWMSSLFPPSNKAHATLSLTKASSPPLLLAALLPMCLASDDELLVVHECIRDVAGLLGSQCMDAFIGLLATGGLHRCRILDL